MELLAERLANTSRDTFATYLGLYVSLRVQDNFTLREMSNEIKHLPEFETCLQVNETCLI